MKPAFLPFEVFQAFFEKFWLLPMYFGYQPIEILESELYDYMYGE